MEARTKEGKVGGSKDQPSQLDIPQPVIAQLRNLEGQLEIANEIMVSADGVPLLQDRRKQ